MIRRMIVAAATLAVAFFLSGAIMGCQENETKSVQQHEQVHKSEPMEVVE